MVSKVYVSGSTQSNFQKVKKDLYSTVPKYFSGRWRTQKGMESPKFCDPIVLPNKL